MTEPVILCAACASPIKGHRPGDECPSCRGEVWLDGRYELLEIVGRGAVGMTYRARRVGDGEVVAIKELSFSRLDTFKKQELFEREARVLRELDHPGVPAYYDELVWGIGKHQAFYIVEEFIQGQTLASEFKSKRYAEEDVLDVIEELSQILEYLHSRAPAVIHRDLKPENIMRRGSGELVIVDFGVVKDGGHDALAGATVAGTFGYMAPEQLRGMSTRASDLYALGVLALEMLTRTPPHEMITSQGALAWRARVKGTASSGMIELLGELLEPDHRARLGRAADVRERVERSRWGAPSMSGALVRAQELEPRVIERSTVEQESLFGVGVALGALALMALPCAAAFFGVAQAVIVASVILLLALCAIPFLPESEEADVEPARLGVEGPE